LIIFSRFKGGQQENDNQHVNGQRRGNNNRNSARGGRSGHGRGGRDGYERSERGERGAERQNGRGEGRSHNRGDNADRQREIVSRVNIIENNIVNEGSVENVNPLSDNLVPNVLSTELESKLKRISISYEKSVINVN